MFYCFSIRLFVDVTLFFFKYQLENDSYLGNGWKPEQDTKIAEHLCKEPV